MFYFASGRNSETMLSFLRSWGRSLSENVNVMPYSRSMARMKPNAGVYVLSDLEKISNRERSAALKLWNKLADRSDVVLLNHPVRTLRRYDLLRFLYQKGINHFNVYRFKEIDSVQRYPVFLRVENDHRGNRSPLLYSSAELYRARRQIKSLKKRRRLIIVEYYDTAGTDGIYRKYSAFVAGGRIVPRHIFFSRSWMIKEPDLMSEELLHEELEYILGNPHKEELLAISELARVDYGRIDYSIMNGKLQVWEINTNPSLASGISTRTPQRATIHQHFVQSIAKTFQEIECEALRQSEQSASVKQ